MKKVLIIPALLLCFLACGQSGILGIVTTGGQGNNPEPSGSYTLTTLTQSAAFEARDGIGLVSYGGALRLMGGWNPNWSPATRKEQWESADGITWTQLADAAWNLPRHTFGHGVLNGAVYVWGNDPYNNTDQSVYKYTTAEGWASLGQMGLPGNRVLYSYCTHTAADTPYLYILGGQTGDSPQWGDTFNNDVYRSADGVTWTKVADLPAGMQNLSNGTMQSFNGALYVMGGGEYWSNGAHTYKSQVWKSADHGATWAQVTTNDDTIFNDQYPNSCVFDGKLWYLKGSNQTRGGVNGNAQGLYYSSDGVTWTRLEGDTAIPARHASSMAVHGGALYIVAGNLWNDAYKITATQ